MIWCTRAFYFHAQVAAGNPIDRPQSADSQPQLHASYQQRQQHDALMRQLQDSLAQYPPGVGAAAAAGQFLPQLLQEQHPQR